MARRHPGLSPRAVHAPAAIRLAAHPAPPATRPGHSAQGVGRPSRRLSLPRIRRASNELPIAVGLALAALRPLARRLTVHSSRTRIAASFKCLVGGVVSAPDSRVAGRLNSSVRPLKAMNPILTEVRRIGGDPADAAWQWFVTRGPHGSDFTWAQTKSSPLGRARSVALAALRSPHPELVRRGLQVLGVVGTGVDLESVKPLAASQDPAVAADAKACIFQLKRAA